VIESRSALCPQLSIGGLTVLVRGAVMFVNGQILAVPDTSVALPANKTNYVYLHASTGLVEANTSGFPGGALPIGTAVTGTFDVLSLTDTRPDFIGANIGTPISFHNRIPRWMMANGNTAAISIINDNASHTITTGANIASTATAPDQLAVTTSSTQNSPTAFSRRLTPSGQERTSPGRDTGHRAKRPIIECGLACPPSLDKRSQLQIPQPHNSLLFSQRATTQTARAPRITTA
jgi:hypothetical protein